jgi:large subunit ribosomal protein L4
MMNKITTHRTKRFRDITASRHKIRPQKGTGRARAGRRFAPRMRGGVKAHGPVPRNFSIRMNKKVILQALKVTLAAKLHDQSLIIVDNYPQGFKKTKEADKALKVFGLRYLLVAPDDYSEEFVLATRRLEYLQASTVGKVKVLDLVKAKKAVFTVDAILKMQEQILSSEKKLYMNRKLYRKQIEIKRKEKESVIEPVVVKSKVLKDIVEKYGLDIQTA